MYVPNNRIKTNKYTQGDEYVLKSTNKNYVGWYHTLYNGKIYTGKTPNDDIVEELIDINKVIDSLWENEAEGNQFQQFVSNWDGEVYKDQFQNEQTIIDYNRLVENDMTKVTLIPSSYYPQPTKDDYNKGTFIRYFCVKINENKFIELSEEIYNKILNKDANYSWAIYTPFKLTWTIKGEYKQVIKTNKDIISLTEAKLKRKGLDAFLRQNYQKFWKF